MVAWPLLNALAEEREFEIEVIAKSITPERATPRFLLESATEVGSPVTLLIPGLSPAALPAHILAI